MRIGLISDVHGNYSALEAVLRDASRQSIAKFVLLGDIVFMGLEPQRCMDALMALDPLACIKGNTDANLEELGTFAPSNQFERQLMDLVADCAGRLDALSRSAIASWPIVKGCAVDQLPMLFCHGSPYSFKDRLLPDGKTDGGVAERLGREESGLVCCGHTHQGGDFLVAGKRTINPGAVGYSLDGDPRPSYCVLEIGGSGEVDCRLLRVEYDAQAYVDALAREADRLPLLANTIHAVKYGKPMR